MPEPGASRTPDAVAILQRLIRFDTSNPPGEVEECIGWIRGLLAEAGIESLIVERRAGRPNLVARLPGRGDAPPLLLYGHVDVVPVAGQPWSRPPFSGDVVDGVVWGRGALDMKSGVAMMLSAVLRAKAEGAPLPGDVILALVPDEETGGADGAGYLAGERAELFRGVRHAIGEFGGFPIHVAGRPFYAIQVAEKSMCWMRATARGRGGHAAMPERNGAVAKLARAIARIDETPTPIHIVDAARHMFTAIADNLDEPLASAFRGLLDPARADAVLDRMGEQAALLRGAVRNTFSPTVLRAGEKINVIPRQATVEIDGRLLPGFSDRDAIAELRAILGELADSVEFEVLQFDPCPDSVDMSLFDTLAGVIREMDPGGVPIPLFLTAVTDARHFARIGIQTYGFLPLLLPPDMNFVAMIHNADERVPKDAVEFGAEAVYRAILRPRPT
ncbi:MAG: M20/M25/M40 family metallo-hydrolase [Clostridia bacterium]|nr:M20/M25/M40 family metallo-hydrolase [Clostridia bacterium]